MLGILVLTLVLTAAIRLGTPLLVEGVAVNLPPGWVRASSEQALASLEAEDLLPSRLSEARQYALRDRFAALRAAPEGAPPYRLLFRHSRSGQHTLLTLPGGEIIVTDQLLERAPDQMTQLALLCQALGHLHSRSELRGAVDANLIPLLAAALTGNSERSIQALTRGWQKSHFTLDAALEADRYAFSMLQTNNLPPGLLIDAIEYGQTPANVEAPAHAPLAHRAHASQRLRAVQKLL